MFQSNLAGSMGQSTVPSLAPLCPDLDLTFSPELLIIHPFYWLTQFSSLTEALSTKGTSVYWRYFAETPIAQSEKKSTNTHTSGINQVYSHNDLATSISPH